MRLQLNLKCKQGTLIPSNYRYCLSTAIYSLLGQSDNAFSARLHEHGYLHAGKRYNLFHFSYITFPNGSWKTLPCMLKNTGNRSRLRLGFLMPEALRAFVVSLFQNTSFELANHDFCRQFKVQAVETLPSREFAPVMRYHLTTPLCLKKDRPDGTTAHLATRAEDYAALLHQNLLNKWSASHPEHTQLPDSEFTFSLLPGSALQGKKITVNNSELKCWLFDFELTAPLDFMKWHTAQASVWKAA